MSAWVHAGNAHTHLQRWSLMLPRTQDVESGLLLWARSPTLSFPLPLTPSSLPQPRPLAPPQPQPYILSFLGGYGGPVGSKLGNKGSGPLPPSKEKVQ